MNNSDSVLLLQKIIIIIIIIRLFKTTFSGVCEAARCSGSVRPARCKSSLDIIYFLVESFRKYERDYQLGRTLQSAWGDSSGNVINPSLSPKRITLTFADVIGSDGCWRCGRPVLARYLCARAVVFQTAATLAGLFTPQFVPRRLWWNAGRNMVLTS